MTDRSQTKTITKVRNPGQQFHGLYKTYVVQTRGSREGGERVFAEQAERRAKAKYQKPH